MKPGRRPPVDARPFEISAADLKPSLQHDVAIAGAAAGAFELRGQPVLTAADVAMIFGVETREVVQNIKSNPDIFPERYAFELTQDETEHLRSAGLIPKSGRGGSRKAPWVVTRKGAFRLATIMRGPRAIQATDLIIDIFDEVVSQIQSGRNPISLSNPSRITPAPSDGGIIATARAQLAEAIKSLLNTVVDTERKTTVGDELHAIAAAAANDIKAWFSGKQAANEKIAAETMLIIEQARDMYERRQADLADKALDRDRKAIENLRQRIAVAQEFLKLYSDLEPNALVDLVELFPQSPRASANPPRLALPKKADQ